jgi:uncharacterized protein (TIGR03437 family)
MGPKGNGKLSFFLKVTAVAGPNRRSANALMNPSGSGRRRRTGFRIGAFDPIGIRVQANELHSCPWCCIVLLKGSKILVNSVIPQPLFPAAKVALLASVAFFAQSPVVLSSQVSLPGQSAAPGSSIVIPVAFATQGGSVSGVQFDLQYNSSAMSLAATVGDAARNSGKRPYLADLAPDKRRFLVVGFNQNLIPDGTLVNLFVNLNPNAPNGVYRLKLSNIVGTDPDGRAAPVTGTDGEVTVQGAVGQAVRLQPVGVLSGASLLFGPVAPGEVVTLFGSGIGPASPQEPTDSQSSTDLAGTRVLLDGTPAPLLFAALNQINAVVPYGVSGKAATKVQVTYQGQVIAVLFLSVTATAPAIFTLDSSGVGPGAILNQDKTVNSPSNPTGKGSVVELYATGAGQTDPPGKDGQVAGDALSKPVLPVSVQIGGLDAGVLYAGAAPGLIAGVLQVNCQVPANVATGYSVPVVLTVGRASSQPGVTLAVQ